MDAAYGSAAPSVGDGEVRRSSSSGSHTAAPSVVNGHHDDPARAADQAHVLPSATQRESSHLSANQPSVATGNTTASRKSAAHARTKVARGLPSVARSGTARGTTPAARCDVVFSHPSERSSSHGGGGLASSPATVGTTRSRTAVGATPPPSVQGPSPPTTTSSWTAPHVHRVNHPHGFRILKDTSVIERSMKTYFRLPPAPNARLQKERQIIHKELLRVERAEARELRRVANGAGVLLDGFLLLSAAEVEDPGEVEAVTLQSSHIVGAIAEDLTYFQSLFFLDVSENALRLEDLLPLEGLVTLHLAYNRLSSLAGLEVYIQTEQQQREEQWCGTGSTNGQHAHTNDAAALGATTTSKSSALHGVLLPCLQALNLSYNQLPFTDLPYLSYFPCLEKIDLSGNNLRRLPSDLSLLASVTHLALESNGFTSSPENDVFLPLSTMPSLQEVNLNNNAISAVPNFSVQDGRGLCFPCIETIGLSENKFKRPEALQPLASLHRSLRRVVLSRNPMSTDTVLIKRTRQQFDQVVVDAYYERVLLATATRSAPSAGAFGLEAPFAGTTQADREDSGSVAAAATTATAGPRNADEALWRGESWSRFIPADTSAGDVRVDDTDTDFTSAVGELGSPPGAGDAPTLRNSLHSATTASRPMLATQGTETLSAEEYFYQYRVELVFDEFKMPKQSLRHFYSTGLREGGQNTLVTIPDYKEFMDIYRITGRKKSSWKSQLPGSGAKHKPVPAVARSWPAAPEAAETSHECTESAAGSVEDAALRTPKDVATPHEDVAFFMTEVNDEDDRLTHAQKPSEKEPVKAAVPNAPSVAEVPHRQRAPRTAEKTRQNRLPPSSVSPPSSSVHTAMHELRAILRKPLPPLPYGATGTKAAHQPNEQPEA